MLTNNGKKCKEVDDILGVNSEIEAYYSTDEDTSSHRCPIHERNGKVVKLRRHLSIHKLTERKLLYAIECSNNFANNSTSSKSTQSSKQVKKSNLNLVNKRCNNKICPICNHLFMNITDYLKNAHNMQKDDPDYKYTQTWAIILKCYTKKRGGKNVLLADKSLEAAKEKHEEILINRLEFGQSWRLWGRKWKK